MEIPEKIQKYADEHSLDLEFIQKEFNVTWNNDTITIPIYGINNEFLYNKYRHLEGSAKFTFGTGGHPMLFCSNKVVGEESVVLCEGEIDVLRLWQEGVPAVTGTAGVATFNCDLAESLKGKVVYVCLDSDDAGQKQVGKYLTILKDVGADPMVMQLPREFKDVSIYFTSGKTKEDFQELGKKALTPEDWQDQNESEDFGLETADEILLKEISPERWLVDKVIPIEGLCFIVGPEATAKSFHALMIANSVVTGKAWLGKFEVKKQTSVLIIDKENTQRRIQDRLRGLNISGKNIYWLKYPQKLELSSPENKEDGFTDFIKVIARRVKKYKIGLIIVDSFTDLLIGDENDRAAIQDFVSAFKQLFPLIAYLILHHAGKQVAGNHRPTSQMARGSTNIMAQCYSAFHTEPVRKSKTQFTIEQTKAGDSIKMNKFIIELKAIPDPFNSNETLINDIEYIGEVQEKEEELSKAIELIEEKFAVSNRIPRKQLLEELMIESVSTSTFERAIRQLKDDRKIKTENSETVKRGQDYIWIDSEEAASE